MKTAALILAAVLVTFMITRTADRAQMDRAAVNTLLRNG